MHVLALLVTAAVGLRLASDSLGRVAAVALLLNPLSVVVAVTHWIEPLMMMLLGLTVWAMHERRFYWIGVPLGLFFASKQFTIVCVPLLWTVVGSAGRRAAWTAVAVGITVVVPFLIWDPAAFIHSAVTFHLEQPFRTDAISLPNAWREQIGPVAPWVPSLSLIVGSVVGALVAWRAKPGPTTLALGVGLSLLITVLLSKQAAANYFILAGTALLLAGISWPSDDPMPLSSERQGA